MKYNELTIQKSRKSNRVGRGIAAGQGKTAGRGTKGQNSRTGGGVRLGFEGGQNPLAQRLPKLPGFTPIRLPAETVKTEQLDELGVNITNQVLYEAGLVSSPFVKVKLVVKGPLAKKHTVKLQSASKASVRLIEKAGGSYTKIDRLKRPAKQKSKV